MYSSSILIVEDELLVAKDIKHVLERDGYTVTGIEKTGINAIEHAGRENPDLVLMDIILQDDMDGIDAANAIRESFEIPIVFLTSHADEITLERARATEPYSYILKPFDDHQLLVSISMTLYKAKMDRSHELLLREKERLLEEKEQALKEVKILRGMLPICMHCKKIRDDNGYWTKVEDYVRKHSEAEFSHGICPDCMEKYYYDVDENGDEESGNDVHDGRQQE